MATQASRSLRITALAALFTLAAGLTGLAFAGWADKGAAIFMATVEAGLAMCF